jgi:arsenite methyltransferase
MTNNPFDCESDVWSQWLLHRRDADDAAYGRVVRGVIQRLVDRVLDAAHLSPEMTLVDVGTGEGILAFRAIERIGPSLRVMLTDISAPMLGHAEALAAERQVRDQCKFIECSAEKLAGIEDASADVVATRAALVYVGDKRAALLEFHRVLKPGGRISMAEPIFQDQAFEAVALKTLVDAQGPSGPDELLPLLHRWKAAQFPDSQEKVAANPIANFSERDLLHFVKGAGFTEIHLELHIDVAPSTITSWDVFLDTSPHPWAPPLRLILAERFSPTERQLFEDFFRPTVEAGKYVSTDRIVYLTAKKPLPR